MSSSADTLNISPLSGPKSAPPIAAVQREETTNHPEAAAMARSRIDAIPELYPLIDATEVPRVPTAELVLDRDVLAGQLKAVPAVSHKQLPPMVRSALTAAGIFLALLLLFKSPVILSEVSYLFNKPAATPSASQSAASVIPAAATITIPKINVSAPVVYEQSVAEAQVQKALENGVDHYGNTPAPGDGGNAVFFGHSSNDWWEPGNFKFVFVLLDKLAPGDRFSIDYQSKRYTYEVTGSRIVLPTDLSVLTQTSEPTVTLITCTPPGTALKRLVVTAKQVDPDPATSTKPAAKTSGGNAGANLPGAAPSFLTQLGQGWNSFIHSVTSLFGADSSSSTPTPSASPASSGSLPAVK